MKYKSWCVAQISNQKGKPWQAILKYKDENQKWKNKKKTLGVMGKKEAERQALEWFNEMNAQAEISPEVKDERTVDDVVIGRLDYLLSIGKLEKSTHRMYMNNYKNNVQPYLGGLVFAEVDRHDLEAWLTKLHNKGLKQNTIYNAYTVPKTVYSYYFKIGEIEKNPFLAVSEPKGEKRQTHMDRKQMDEFITDIYLSYLPYDPMYTAMLLMYYTGLRRGEVCALRWSDIDFEGETVSVNSAVGIAAHGTYTKPPKNKSSIRKFPMIPQVKELLLERYKHVKPYNSWFVVGEKEKYLSPSALSKRMQEFVEYWDLRDVYGKLLTSHALRHNLGMVGIKSGMDIASLSKMFGHASRAMTLDRYGDYSKDAALVAAGKLSETFEKGSFYEGIKEVSED